MRISFKVQKITPKLWRDLARSLSPEKCGFLFVKPTSDSGLALVSKWWITQIMGQPNGRKDYRRGLIGVGTSEYSGLGPD